MVSHVGRRCAAVLVFALAACSSNGGGASPAASGSGGTIAIGIDLPLSGADASDGRPTANGAILAIEQANAHGFAHGAYALKAELLDDAVQGKHDPAAGAQNVKTFIAGYKAPRSMEIADALPLSGAGKVLKRELRQKYWDGTERQVH